MHILSFYLYFCAKKQNCVFSRLTASLSAYHCIYKYLKYTAASTCSKASWSHFYHVILGRRFFFQQAIAIRAKYKDPLLDSNDLTHTFSTYDKRRVELCEGELGHGIISPTLGL